MLFQHARHAFTHPRHFVLRKPGWRAAGQVHHVSGEDRQARQREARVELVRIAAQRVQQQPGLAARGEQLGTLVTASLAGGTVLAASPVVFTQHEAALRQRGQPPIMCPIAFGAG